MRDTGQCNGLTPDPASSLVTNRCVATYNLLALPNASNCHHGLQRQCNVCDVPIPYVLTTDYFIEREQERLTEWHATLRAEAESRGPSAHLGREA